MSLKKNFFYSSILTVSTYLFPLLVYPYVSRVLGVSNIGIVNFIDNLVNYFVLVSMMGITTIGTREIAVARDKQTLLTKTFSSLMALTAITTLIAIVALWIAMYTVHALIPHKNLLYIGIVKLIFNFFLIEWFYMGTENFRYITNRSILIKTLYVISVFLFVKEASDYKIYYYLSVALVVINALVNIIYSRHFVKFNLKAINIRLYAKPFLLMGIYVLLTNVYLSLNPVWLGFVTNTDEVGYFTTATKLHTIIMGFLISFANILFPRVSHLLAEGKTEEFWQKINTAFDAIFLFAFPTIVYICVAGPELLSIIVGNGFEGSYTPLRIITPLVLIIGIEQILVIQILIAMHQDYIVLRNSFFGALATFIFNVLLTSSMGAVGSAIVWVIAELVITTLTIISIYQHYNYLPPFRRLFNYIVIYAPLLIIEIAVYFIITNKFISVGVLATLTFIYVAICERYVLKNVVFYQILKSIHLIK